METSTKRVLPLADFNFFVRILISLRGMEVKEDTETFIEECYKKNFSTLQTVDALKLRLSLND